ncbi:solute carrier family 23 member 1-like isoform X2 [Crassostrea angulata]|uniref:solute carrier family 23 member 1-like isoform X2 n=1 Tax=Magallana angulata TaxID=2784310 RepID=UPI0022B183F5|nr:solute carrier family 23 member 1-like isoform X2 [Crassostrea angulata]
MDSGDQEHTGFLSAIDDMQSDHQDKNIHVQVSGKDGSVQQDNSLEVIEESQSRKLLYRITDVPPWYLCIILGFQQSFTSIGGIIALPVIIHKSLCMGGDTVGLSELIQTALFTVGMATIVQSVIGIRLPIIQGATAAFLIPVIALMSQPEWRCPFNEETSGNDTINLPEVGSQQHRLLWTRRLSVVSGSLMVASVFQMFLGVTGLVGFLLRFIGPITISVVTSSISLSLFPIITSYAQKQWYIAFATIALVVTFSQYLKRWKICELFPILLSVGLSWLLCFVLTVTGVFTDDPNGWGYGARTDIKTDVLTKTSWFRFPHPGQFGWPSVSIAGTCGMLAGVIASVMESIGDYYACALQSDAGKPPSHAINRGIAVEGLGCLLCGLWGAGIGTTSYSENIGAISITRVASRAVSLVAGCIFMIMGCIGKVAALFVTIPEPVLGGLFHVTLGMVLSVGLSNLQFVDMSSPRNIFVVGTSISIGQTLPNWLNANISSINTGITLLDQIINVLLGTHMFVAGIVACFLDNTVPGTREERGFTRWKKSTDILMENTDSNVYDFPFFQRFLNRLSWTSYIPVCPAFQSKKKRENAIQQTHF